MVHGGIKKFPARNTDSIGNIDGRHVNFEVYYKKGEDDEHYALGVEEFLIDSWNDERLA